MRTRNAPNAPPQFPMAREASRSWAQTSNIWVPGQWTWLDWEQGLLFVLDFLELAKLSLAKMAFPTLPVHSWVKLNYIIARRNQPDDVTQCDSELIQVTGFWLSSANKVAMTLQAMNHGGNGEGFARPNSLLVTKLYNISHVGPWGTSVMHARSSKVHVIVNTNRKMLPRLQQKSI